jgi:hypothetical protein
MSEDQLLNHGAVCLYTGRFLAELTKQVFSDLSGSKYQVTFLFFC